MDYSLGLSLRSLRSRFAFLKSLNSDVERLLLPVTDLRSADSYNLSTATLLREARGLLFYHTKVALLNHVLNHTAHRGAEDSPPEVSLDPLEALEGNPLCMRSTCDPPPPPLQNKHVGNKLDNGKSRKSNSGRTFARQMCAQNFAKDAKGLVKNRRVFVCFSKSNFSLENHCKI